MSASILITGGTGKTGRRVVELLGRRGVPAYAATRSPRSPRQVRFDWHDPSGFENALDGIGAVYLVAPVGDPAPLGAMQPLIDLALARGVERFVLLSASMIDAGGPLMGAVHAYLAAHAPVWVVLRPSWFMQNFSEQQHLETIRREGRIYSATDDGRVPFIDAADIAAVAVEALTTPQFANGDLILTGPQALSYDDVARHISTVTGRSISHHRLSVARQADRFIAMGMPDEFARALAGMDAAISAGAEDRVSDGVMSVTRRQPNNFQAFARAAASDWALPASELNGPSADRKTV